MSTSKATVTIRAIGRLWMPPMCEAAWERSYDVGSGPFEHDIRSLEDAEDRMALDSGDLSAIEDYEIAVDVSRHYRRPGIVGTIRHSRTVTWHPWRDPDNDLRWSDLAYPAEED